MSFCVSQPTGLSSETSGYVEVNRGHEAVKFAVCFHKFYFN